MFQAKTKQKMKATLLSISLFTVLLTACHTGETKPVPSIDSAIVASVDSAQAAASVIAIVDSSKAKVDSLKK